MSHAEFADVVLAPLQAAEVDVTGLAGLCSAFVDTNKAHAASVQLGLRYAVHRLLTSDANYDVVWRRVLRAIDLAVALARASLCEAATPLSLLQDLADIVPSSQLHYVVDYLEAHADVLLSPPIMPVADKTRLSFLTLCNELLRRTTTLNSSSEHGAMPGTQLRGRIIMFMTRPFELTARSGVNMMGLTNDSHETELDELVRDDSVTTQLQDATGKIVDLKFYRQLWGLQAFVSRPRLETALGKWAELSSRIKAILTSFRTQNRLQRNHSTESRGATRAPVAGSASAAAVASAAAAATAASSQVQAATDADGDVAMLFTDDAAAAAAAAATGAAEGDGADGPAPLFGNDGGYSTGSSLKIKDNKDFFPKFLTDAHLINLQLQDPLFRRQILVQCLILVDSLLASSRVPPPANSRTTRASLSEQQEKELTGWRKDLLRELSATPPDGNHVAKCIERMLEREAAWADWKRRKCPPFERTTWEAATTQRSIAVTPFASSSAFLRRPIARVLDSAPTSSFTAADIEQLQADSSRTEPSLDTYLAPVRSDIEFDTDPDFRLSNDKTWTWKALRIVAHERLDLLVLHRQDIERIVRAIDGTEAPVSAGAAATAPAGDAADDAAATAAAAEPAPTAAGAAEAPPVVGLARKASDVDAPASPEAVASAPAPSDAADDGAAPGGGDAGGDDDGGDGRAKRVRRADA